MLTTTSRRALTAALLAALVAASGAACGSPSDSGGGGPALQRVDTPPSTVIEKPDPSKGKTVADRVAYFSSSARVTAGVHEVLHDQDDVARFAGKVAANDPKVKDAIVAGARPTDFSRRVLVGWTATTGCSAATAATLTVSGKRLTVQVSQPKPPPECLVAFRMTAVFEVPKERVPAQPVFS
jgi:hypothetical protein